MIKIAISALHIVEDDEPGQDSLEKLADSLAGVREILPSAAARINDYEDSVSIVIRLKQFRQAKGYGGHEVFRVYDPGLKVSQRNVADNKDFIAGSMKHPRCYNQIRKFLESLGYKNFHNSYSDYIEQRFREYIAKK